MSNKTDFPYMKKYRIAGITLLLESDEEILDNGMFSHFLTDSSGCADFTVRAVRGLLPNKAGRQITHDGRRSYYKDESGEYYYCAYYNSSEEKYVDFSCRVQTRDGITLYINYGDTLWSSMLFEGLGLPDMLLSKNAAVIHASYIITNGEAILFTADKQIGKSTQAALWEKCRGAQVINGDRAVLRELNGRLYAFGVPFCGTSGICRNVSAPVKAVVSLGQAKKNTAVRLSEFEGYKEIIGKLTYSSVCKRSAAAAHEAAQSIAGLTPVYKLSCLPDVTAVECLEGAL